MKQKRNTLQKGIVFEVFREMHNHPSAGMIYDAVHEKYPEISKATVYRLMAEAAEDGNVLRLKLADADDRYDVTLDHHYHVVCRECGAVADVYNKGNDIDEESIRELFDGCEDFTVDEIHIEFSGLCKECQQKIKNKQI